MSKGTTIISDLRSFFSENENNRAINAIMRVMECINIRPDQIGTEKKEHNRTLKCTYCTIDVKFAGTTVRLFFSKRGRNGHWNGLLTTDLSLSFLKAYRTYATRWTTEVVYHDCKQLLDFGRCQSVHFSAQIASFTLTMMQYNILCTVKRFEAYETVGALFREATTGTLELSASDRIWELILDTILEIAEMISADASELLSAVIDANPKFHKLYQMYKLVA